MFDGIGRLIAGALEELRAELRAELERRVAEVRDEVLARVEARSARRCLSVAEACEAYSFSRATWDRWLADPTTGLEAVVLRPNGPGGRVLVPVEAFEAWLRARSGGPDVARRTA